MIRGAVSVLTLFRTDFVCTLLRIYESFFIPFCFVPDGSSLCYVNASPHPIFSLVLGVGRSFFGPFLTIFVVHVITDFLVSFVIY